MIVVKKDGFIVTEEKNGKLLLWEKCKKMIKHSVFRLFGGDLYGRYDAVATPLDEYRAAYKEFVRQEAQAIIRGLISEPVAQEVPKPRQRRRNRCVDSSAGRRLSA